MINASIQIMLIEDDEIDIECIKRAFKKNNIANPLHIARNGVEALNKLCGKHGEQKIEPTPKIILLDINMPKMNGIEFLKTLRQDNLLKSISVFILTSSDEERDIISAYDLNVSGYIIKPVEFDRLTEALKTLNLFWSLIELPK